MLYWPSTSLIVATLVLMGYRVVTGGAVPYELLIVALAYHHWQAHSSLSDGTNTRADAIRMGVAIAWTVLALGFLWLS